MSGTNPRRLPPSDESPASGELAASVKSASSDLTPALDGSAVSGSSSQYLSDVRIERLLDLFYGDGEHHGRLGKFTSVETVPGPYDRLLDHHEHMTVTVEAFHRQKVDVRVHRTSRSGDSDRSKIAGPKGAGSPVLNPGNWYAREITLVGSESGKVVQYGIVRLNVDTLSPDVWRQIESQSVPLGRVLIENDVLREVQLQGLWRVEAGPALAELLDVPLGETVYGRTALIYCDGEPAIELLEIVVDR